MVHQSTVVITEDYVINLLMLLSHSPCTVAAHTISIVPCTVAAHTISIVPCTVAAHTISIVPFCLGSVDHKLLDDML